MHRGMPNVSNASRSLDEGPSVLQARISTIEREVDIFATYSVLGLCQ